MDELGACDVAAQDVGVGCIAKRDHGIEASTAQFSCNKELACIASESLVSSHGSIMTPPCAVLTVIKSRERKAVPIIIFY